MIRRRRIAAFAVAAAAAVVTACTASVPSGDLEAEVSKQLEKSTGTKPDSVSCPDDLKAEKDAKVTCKATDGDKKYDVVLTVTDASDKNNVKFDIDAGKFGQSDSDTDTGNEEEAPVDEESNSVDKAAVEGEVRTQLAAKLGHAPQSVTCEQDLPARVGADLSCVLVDDGKDYDVYVTVTEVKDDGTVLFDINAPRLNAPTVPMVDGGAVADEVRTQLAAQLGFAPETVVCDQDLPSQVGEYIYCGVAHEGESGAVKVTVTEVTADGTTKFDIQIEE